MRKNKTARITEISSQQSSRRTTPFIDPKSDETFSQENEITA
jgi:hypothetical protein